MAAKPLDPEIIEAVLIDWRMGRMSIRDLADKHKISRGSAGNICKDVEQDVKPIVDAGIQYQQELHRHDGLMVDAVTALVAESAKRMEWLNKANMTVANMTMKKLGTDRDKASYQDLNAASTIFGRTKDNVFGKAPDTTINNTNAQQNQLKTITILRAEDVVI